MTTLNATDGGLTAAAMTSLRTYFTTEHHSPSEQHWDALNSVLTVMEDMAGGRCEPKVLLGSLDCGIGKSQCAVHFGRALVASERHRDVGMIICVGRREEAAALASKLTEHGCPVGVLTSDGDTNECGTVQPPYAAQVLVTTQQRIELLTQGRAFADVECLHYLGRPRAVRCWDEAWLPGRTLTLKRDDIGGLRGPMRRFNPALGSAIDGWDVSLYDVDDGDLVMVPDFEVNAGVSLYDALSSLSPDDDDGASTARAERDRTRDTLVTLIALNGKATRAIRDGRTGQTLLSFKDTLPDDLAPLLVLDASVRVRTTYRHMEERRGNVVQLKPEGVKDYGPLRFTCGAPAGPNQDGRSVVIGSPRASRGPS